MIKTKEKRREKRMIKQLAWNAFKNTGDINSYLEFVEVENMEKEMEKNLLITEEKKKPNLGENIGIDTK